MTRLPELRVWTLSRIVFAMLAAMVFAVVVGLLIWLGKMTAEVGT